MPSARLARIHWIFSQVWDTARAVNADVSPCSTLKVTTVELNDNSSCDCKKWVAWRVGFSEKVDAENHAVRANKVVAETAMVNLHGSKALSPV